MDKKPQKPKSGKAKVQIKDLKVKGAGVKGGSRKRPGRVK
jgi:hypothetical protein